MDLLPSRVLMTEAKGGCAGGDWGSLCPPLDMRQAGWAWRDPCPGQMQASPWHQPRPSPQLEGP